MKRLISALVSFVVVFGVIFVLSGWFVTPHLPKLPDIPAKISQPEFWTSNWPGVSLGGLMGLVSARSIVSRKKTKKKK